MSWFNIPEPTVQWLVDGLIPADSSTAIVGKPKAGKSTAIRNLIVSVVTGRPFLNRSIDLPSDTGRVLYVHLDRKDKDWRVAKELKQLGITEEQSSRITFRSAADMTQADFPARLKWLRDEVTAAQPHLVVIDLLWQFAVVNGSSNDYNAVLTCINTIQDALTSCGYRGALVATIHSRKATSTTDQYDDILGSTGQRGSFSTIIMLAQRKSEKVYTISSDQTERDDVLGEIPETILTRNADRTLQLGPPLEDLVKQARRSKFEDDVQRLISFVAGHPGTEMDTITGELGISKKHALKLLTESSAFIGRDGSGTKGDAYRYYEKTGETQ